MGVLTQTHNGLKFTESPAKISYNTTDIITIKSDGTVGIGTTSPDNTLHVHKGSAGTVTANANSPIVIENSVNAYLNILVPDASESGVLFGRPTSNVDGGIIYNSNISRGLEFRTAGNTYRMGIDSNGYVGIGTTSPMAKLTFPLEEESNYKIAFKSAGTTHAGISTVDQSGAGLYIASNSYVNNSGVITYSDSAYPSSGIYFDGWNTDSMIFYTAASGAPSERMRITSGGSVGINTTSPQDFLHIRTGLGWGARITYTGDDSYLRLSSNQIAAFNSSNGAADLYLNHNSSGNVLFTGGGKVGIGTTSPASRLNVVGDGAANTYSGTLRVANTNSSQWGSICLPSANGTQSEANNYYLIGRGSSVDDRVMSFHIPYAANYGNGSQPKFGFYSTGADLLHSIEASTGTSYFKGNVGIGATSPSSKLHVGGASTPASSAIPTAIQLDNTYRNAVGGNTSLKFYLYKNNTETYGIGLNNAAGVEFHAGTNASDPSAYYAFYQEGTEKVRIAAGGNVGIGTTSPAYKLQVDGSTGVRNGAFYIGDETGSTNSAIEFYKSGTTLRMYTNTGAFGGTYGTMKASLALYSGSAYNILIDGNGDSYFNAGNIGIGTTSPSDILHVYKSGANTRLIVGNNAAYDQFIYFQGNTDWSMGIDYSNSNAFTLGNYSSIGTSVRLTVTTDGNVGIGTTSPSGSLDIYGTTGNKIRIGYFTDQGADDPTLRMFYGKATRPGYSFTSDNTSGMFSGSGGGFVAFATSANERMRITSGGNVGIGTTSPSFQLDVFNSIGFNGRSFKEQKYLELAGNARNALWLDRTSFSNGYSSGAVNIIFPNAYMQGYLKITLSDSYSNQNITGALTKLIPFGWNLNGSIWGDGSNYEITEAVGGIATDFTIGDIAWDSSSSKYYIPIYKLSSNGNGLKVRVEYFGENGSALTGVALSSVYQTTPPSKYSTRHYQNINDRLGIGTTSPAQKLEVSGNILASKIGTGGSINTSYDLYNNGTTYLNGETIVDDNLYVTSGKVGINTTSPGSTLDIVSSGINIYRATDTGGQYRWRVDQNFDMFMTNSAGVDKSGIKNDGSAYFLGNVGVGTSSPEGGLHVASSSSGGIGGQIVIDNPAGSTLGNTAEISFLTDAGASGTGTRNARILAVNENAGNGAANMQFHTWNGAASAERMRITSGGNVGIGTTAPNQKLHVVGSDSVGIRVSGGTNNRYIDLTSGNLEFYTTSTSGWAMGNVIKKNSDGSTLGYVSGGFGQENALTYTYYGGTAYNSAAMYILSSNKNVGIGTSSPDYTLDVEKDVDTWVSRIYNTGSDANAQTLLVRSDATSAHDALVLGVYADGGYKMVVRSTGNVGIGTTSPATKLNIDIGSGGTNGIAGLRIGGTNNYPSLELGIYGAYGGMVRSYGNDIHYFAGHWQTIGSTASENHSHYWYTSKNGSSDWSTVKMELDHDGNLGIGTTSPGAKTHISGGGFDLYLDYSSTNAAIGISSLKKTDGKNALVIGRYHSTNNSAAIRFDYVGDNSSGNYLGLGFYANDDLMVIKPSGNVGIGTTSPGKKLDVAGQIRQIGGGDYWYVSSAATFTSSGREVTLSRSSYSYVVATPYGAVKKFNASVAFKTTTSTHLGITFLAADESPENNNYAVILRNVNTVRVQKRVSGTQTYPISEVSLSGTDIDDGNWHTISVSFDGAYISVDVDGTNYISQAWTDTTWTSGMVGPTIYDGSVEFNDFSCSELTSKNVNSTLLVSGNVGIGTTSPNAPLHVSRSTNGINQYIYNSSSGQAYIALGNATTGLYSQDFTSANGMLVGVDSDETAVVWNAENTRLRFGTNNSERLSITGSGNVGIGTTSPEAELDVNGRIAIRSSNRLYFGHTTTLNSWTTAQYASSSTHVFNAQAFVFNNEGYGSTEYMRINTSGNVGIGTTSPAYKLDVSGGAIAIRGNAAGNSLRFDDSAGTSRNAFYVDTSNYLNIGNANYAGVKFVQTASSPTSGEFAGNQIQNAIGSTSNGVVLAEPSAWLAVRVGTTDYAIPMYTTG